MGEDQGQAPVKYEVDQSKGSPAVVAGATGRTKMVCERTLRQRQYEALGRGHYSRQEAGGSRGSTQDSREEGGGIVVGRRM